MFKSTTTYKVEPNVRLDKIFVNGLPINGFVDKGRCAIGGTYSEIMNKKRCSIIVVPNISILLDKKASHPEIDIVYGDVTYEQIKDMFKIKKAGHKIMTTPEAMRRIMKAADKTRRTLELTREWFLLLDESHTFITEHYREDILAPFEFFWDFTNKCIVSATPFVFTDERFRALDYHNVQFDDYLNKVTLVNAISVVGSLNHLLTRLDEFPGNIHVFYNSVTEIKNAILRSGITDFNIFCADDSNNKNFKKLGDLAVNYVSQPSNGIYKKVNFYTCKYFEGWDLNDENATVVLVTDVHRPNTRIGVSTKGKQAIGRLRDTPYQIIHITNHNYSKTMKPLETFRKEYLHEAKLLLKQNDEYVADCITRNVIPQPDPRLIKYADIDKDTNKSTLNLMKLDQQINEAANNEVYNDISYLEESWRSAYYDVEVQNSDLKLETHTSVKRKSASKQLEEDYLQIMAYRDRQQNGPLFNYGRSIEELIKENNPTAYLAAKYLDTATMKLMKYNVKKVNSEIIKQENNLIEVKLLRLLDQSFKVGMMYTNQFIKSKLQDLYDNLNIRDDSGKIRVATASQLGENGRFEIKAAKNRAGQHCMVIQRAQFGLRMAA